MPCFLDKLSPDELAWPEGARYRRRPFDFGKIWWSLRMAELGCVAAFRPLAVLSPVAVFTLESVPLPPSYWSDSRAGLSPACKRTVVPSA